MNGWLNSFWTTNERKWPSREGWETMGALLELRELSEIQWMPLIMTRPTLIGWSGALFGCFLLPTGSPSTFPDTLPGAHSRSEQREPAGSTVHHRIRLASLPRAAPAQQARILGAINTYLAPTSLPELLNANSLQRGHFYARLLFVQQTRCWWASLFTFPVHPNSSIRTLWPAAKSPQHVPRHIIWAHFGSEGSKQDQQGNPISIWPSCSELLQLGGPGPQTPEAPTQLQLACRAHPTHIAYINVSSTHASFSRLRERAILSISYK